MPARLLAALAAAVAAMPATAAFSHGDEVFLTVARSKHRVTAQRDGAVHAKWNNTGTWERFVIEREAGEGEVAPGDVVQFRAWTGKRLTVQNKTVHAHWDHQGHWQKFVIESKSLEAPEPIVEASTIYLKAHTGARVDADAPDSPGVVQARWSHRGLWQAFLLESAPPTTEAPTTEAPTTEAPTTTEAATTTEAPTTEAPTTEAPTTEEATTAPTTEEPTTEEPTTEEPTTEAPTTEAPTTTVAPTTTTEAPTTTTPPPTTTTLPPTTEAPTTTTLPPTTTTLLPTTTTLPPTTTTMPPTTTTLPPTPEPTTTLPPTTTPTPTTTTGLPRCSQLTTAEIPQWLTVKDLSLPGRMRECTGTFEIQMSCRHAYYAASPATEYHAMVYNDYTGKARVVMFDGQDNIAGVKEIGSEKVRGLQFDPSARHLVALISGGTNRHPTNSSFVKLRVPSLEILWSKEVGSNIVGVEKWTPDNSDHMAISEDRYVLHTGGECNWGWCAGHQGDMYRVLNATTGEQMFQEQQDWQASHSCKQMIAYNEVADSFLVANMGDAYPEALKFTAWQQGHLKTKLEIPGWATPGGRQGFTNGAIKGDPWGHGFAGVWSHGERYDDPDKLFFAVINVTRVPSKSISFMTPPRKVFPDSGTRTQIGANLAPLGGGRWLVAYTDSWTNRINDHLRIWFEDWSIPEKTRKQGTKLAILDAAGEVLGEPVDTFPIGEAFMPIEINHLMRRPRGIGWIGLEGPGSDKVKVMQLRCQPDAPLA